MLVVNCSGGDTPVDTVPADDVSPANNESTSSDSNTEPETDPLAEHVTITVMMPHGTSSGDGPQDDDVSKYIEEIFNITLDLTYWVSYEQVAALRASGGMPDLIMEELVANQIDMMEMGAVLDLLPLINDYGPHLSEYFSEVIDKMVAKEGTGELHWMPTGVNPQPAVPDGAHIGPYIRWDYYKELGARQWESWYDYFDDIAEALERWPVNEDGRTNQGLSFPAVGWGYLVPYLIGTYSLAEAYPPNSMFYVTRDMQTNELIDCIYQDKGSFWYGFEALNYAYRLGIIDPDSFTQSDEDLAGKINSAAVIGSVIGWLGWGMTDYLDSQGYYGRGMNNTATHISINGTYNSMNKPWPTGIDKKWGINSTAKNPERCMMVLDWFASTEGCVTITTGIKGLDWDIDSDGKYIVTRDGWIRGSDEDLDIGRWKYGNCMIWYANAISLESGQPVNIFITNTLPDDLADEVQQNSVTMDMFEYYGVSSSFELDQIMYMPKAFETIPDYMAYFEQEPYGDLEDEYKNIIMQADNYMNSAWIRIIMAETDEAYEAEKQKIRDDLEALGLRPVIELTMQKYQECIDAALAAQ